MQSTLNIRDLRRTNRRKVFENIYFRGPISRLDLSEICGLSAATVTNVVSELLVEGYIKDTGNEESQGGRPRTMLNINPSYGYFVGVDVGETHVALELFDLSLQKLETLAFSVEADTDRPPQIEAHILYGVQTILAKTNVAPEAVLGIGIGVPGVVDANGIVMAPAWNWQPVALGQYLSENLAIPVFVDNGAKAMAQAEMWFGAGQGATDLAVLLIGTGVGAGLITEGVLYRGTSNSAGELGHTTIVVDGWVCRCGNNGCLEAYVGGPGIVRRLKERNPEHPALIKQFEQRQIIAAIAEAAGRSDSDAAAVLTQTARFIGAGLANVINLVNPQKIILGGWVIDQIGPLIMPELKAYVKRSALSQPFNASTFTLCQLGTDAVCMGAATIALEKFLTAPIKKSDRFA